MNHSQIQSLIDSIDEQVEKPLVSAAFGDNWKEHAADHYTKEDLIEIAWSNGRRAILLTRALREHLED